MQRIIKSFLPHIIVLFLFVIASVGYFSPVLQGKKIIQSDIVQYTGMAKQQNDFRNDTGEETYWTNAAFGGMPTYQLGAKYPHNYIKQLDLALRFLPRPADYLFLYFIGIYILFLVLKLDYKLAFVGALAFGFSTYLIIILGVGHNAKAHAIAYMPLVLSGIFLTFRRKYLYGFVLTTIALGLELVANHFQMTYYLLMLVIIIGAVYLFDAFRKKILPHFLRSVGILALGAVIAVGLNATNILATKEYADTSTRGKTELTINADGTPKANSSGLDYKYITEYSYGIIESFNLFIPRFMGGGSGDPVPRDSKTLDTMIAMGVGPQDANQILNQVPMYWGDQPIVAAPAYIGAVIIFLALMALFLIKGKTKWWIIAAFLLSLLLSWGKNFSFLTDLFIDMVPLYNKFRAVSSIQVIIELILPILAVLGLHHILKEDVTKIEKQKALYYTTGILGGLLVIFILFKSVLFDFASPYDRYFMENLGMPFVNAMREDRMALMMSDSIRTLVFVLLSAGILWLFLQSKLKKGSVLVILTLFILVDLIGVDRRYVNNDNFVSERKIDELFQQNGADMQILEDEGHFRVYDLAASSQPARASYFHNSIGGYHAAKPGRFQDIDDFYLSNGNIGILNMLNVKYIITEGKNGGAYAQRNPYANGNAWFVENVLLAQDANDEILLLDSLDTKKTVVIHEDFLSQIPVEKIERDSTATIKLISYKPNHLIYEASTRSAQLVVFSEAYYPMGWNAYIDNKPVDHIRANYMLRALQVPAGNSKIEFVFEPKVIQIGSSISLISSALLGFIILGTLFFMYKNRETKIS